MPKGRDQRKLEPDDVVPSRELATVSGKAVRIPDTDHLVHVQFRRFAGCPICNLHLQSIVRRHDEIVAASVREVVVFHSTAEALRPHARDLPFAVVADPDKRLYEEFGVESAPRALLDPRAWLPIALGVLHSIGGVLLGKHPVPPVNPDGGSFGLPADFLLASDGRVLARKYGAHAYDQWEVDEILALAGSARVIPRPATDLAAFPETEEW